ncbi:hypothetical protein BURMUCF2_B0685 [Burkholderia multivorans CF2]|nr:hypothetical protein BURMUCF2_B0685 [Burkholderia multivorans CF2]
MRELTQARLAFIDELRKKNHPCDDRTHCPHAEGGAGDETYFTTMHDNVDRQ